MRSPGLRGGDVDTVLVPPMLTGTLIGVVACD
jgi:hypothetical protein